jgi:hypothetical protein
MSCLAFSRRSDDCISPDQQSSGIPPGGGVILCPALPFPFPAQATQSRYDSVRRPAVPTATVDDYGYTFEQIPKEFMKPRIRARVLQEAVRVTW